MSLMRKTVRIDEPVSALLSLVGFSISPQSDEDVLKNELTEAVPEAFRALDTFDNMITNIVGALSDVNSIVLHEPTKLCFFSCIYSTSTASIEHISNILSSKIPNRVALIQLMETTNYLKGWHNVRVS